MDCLYAPLQLYFHVQLSDIPNWEVIEPGLLKTAAAMEIIIAEHLLPHADLASCSQTPAEEQLSLPTLQLKLGGVKQFPQGPVVYKSSRARTGPCPCPKSRVWVCLFFKSEAYSLMLILSFIPERQTLYLSFPFHREENRRSEKLNGNDSTGSSSFKP